MKSLARLCAASRVLVSNGGCSNKSWPCLAFSMRCISSQVARGSAFARKSESLVLGAKNLSNFSFSTEVGRRSLATEAADGAPSWSEIRYEELKKLLEDPSEHVMLIDVREPHEVKELGKIEGSINIPLGDLVKVFHYMSEADFQNAYKVPKPQRHHSNIIFYGQAKWGLAAKSGAAVQMANRLGYNRVRHYTGGYREWKEKHPGQ